MSSALRKTISYDVFIGSLTPTELRAWETVRMHLKRGEKIISISKLLEETKISRPIFKNLFSKIPKHFVFRLLNLQQAMLCIFQSNWLENRIFLTSPQHLAHACDSCC